MLSEHKGVVMECSGALTIGRVEALRDSLLAALGQGGDLEIDCSAATEADVSFIQLLLAARASAVRRGTALRVRDGERGVVAGVFRSGGLRGDDGFWTEGN